MVGIAQLAERLVVVQEVAGSSPVTHPNKLTKARKFLSGPSSHKNVRYSFSSSDSNGSLDASLNEYVT